MKNKFSTIFNKLFCILMAFHIFNISVDMPDKMPDYIPEDLTENDIESVIELVLESGFGIENAIAEHDEPDSDSQNFETSKEFKFYVDYSLLIKQIYFPTVEDIFFRYNKNISSNFMKEISPPPPKA